MPMAKQNSKFGQFLEDGEWVYYSFLLEGAHGLVHKVPQKPTLILKQTAKWTENWDSFLNDELVTVFC